MYIIFAHMRTEISVIIHYLSLKKLDVLGQKKKSEKSAENMVCHFEMYFRMLHCCMGKFQSAFCHLAF